MGDSNIDYKDDIRGDKKEYYQLLKLYFNPLNDKYSLCSCTKPKVDKTKTETKTKIKYKRSVDKNGNLVLECTNSKCNSKVIIQLEEYVNIDNEKNRLNMKKRDIISSLNGSIYSDDQDEFEDLKKSLISIIENINKMEEKYIKNREELDKYNGLIFDLSNKLHKIYHDKSVEYYKINKSKINPSLKKRLVEIFMNEKKDITPILIKTISKDLNIEMDEIQKWFNWFKLSMEYITKNNELNENKEKLIDIQKQFKNNIEKHLKRPYKITKIHGKKDTGDSVVKNDIKDDIKKDIKVDIKQDIKKKIKGKRKKIKIKIKSSGKKKK